MRESGDEAVVNVKMTGSDPESGEIYIPRQYDIWLYKENDRWKIFSFEQRVKGDETYYPLGFYADPAYKP